MSVKSMTNVCCATASLLWTCGNLQRQGRLNMKPQDELRMVLVGADDEFREELVG